MDLLEKLENNMLKLAPHERAFLADRLLCSLHGKEMSDIDEAWIEEAERRYKEYEEGKRPGIKAREVFNEADRLLK